MASESAPGLFLETRKILEKRSAQRRKKVRPWGFFFRTLSTGSVPLVGRFYKQEEDGTWSFVLCLKEEPSEWRNLLTEAEFKLQKRYPELSFTIQVINPDQVGKAGINSLLTQGFIQYKGE